MQKISFLFGVDSKEMYFYFIFSSEKLIFSPSYIMLKKFHKYYTYIAQQTVRL